MKDYLKTPAAFIFTPLVQEIIFTTGLILIAVWFILR